MITRGL
jgi:hypothetical protein